MNDEIVEIEEGVTILECVYMEFAKFVEIAGKREYLVGIWKDLIMEDKSLEVKLFVPAIKSLCREKKECPKFAEIVNKMRFFDCPF